MQGVINGNAEGDGEDDGGRHLQVDVQRAHEPGDEQQRKHVGHEGDQGHAQTAEQQAHDEGDDAEGDEQAQYHIGGKEPVVQIDEVGGAGDLHREGWGFKRVFEVRMDPTQEPVVPGGQHLGAEVGGLGGDARKAEVIPDCGAPAGPVSLGGGSVKLLQPVQQSLQCGAFWNPIGGGAVPVEQAVRGARDGRRTQDAAGLHILGEPGFHAVHGGEDTGLGHHVASGLEPQSELIGTDSGEVLLEEVEFLSQWIILPQILEQVVVDLDAAEQPQAGEREEGGTAEDGSAVPEDADEPARKPGCPW